MKVSSTSQRLQQILSERNLKQADVLRLAEPYCREYRQKLGRSDLSQFVSGKVIPGQWKLTLIALALNVSEAWLMGYDVPQERERNDLPHGMEPPTVTEDYVTFPVIGDLAAGFDHIMCEDWTGDKIDIPVSYLHGRPISDYFCLKVKGDSMYPLYMDGDRVLVLKAPTLQHSGDIGVVRYDGEMATLKKVEYAEGEDWVRLVAINPNYPPHMITGYDLEQCSILGIPKLTLRET